jgi:hypothetical protein
MSPAVNETLTAGLVTACHYADHAQRPDCEHLATVRYGPMPLCP